MKESILQITSGQGPEEVRRFAHLLALRIHSQLLERNVPVLGVTTYGEAGAPRASRIVVCGSAPPVTDLVGTYALLSRSPKRGKKARKRWFCGVELFAAASRYAPALDPSEVRITTMRASGPGGQHVNKTETAVRAVHLPSMTSVRVSAERSQHANRRIALELLAGALSERAQALRAQRDEAMRRHHHQLQRGQARATYRLDRRGRLVPHRIEER